MGNDRFFKKFELERVNCTPGSNLICFYKNDCYWNVIMLFFQKYTRHGMGCRGLIQRQGRGTHLQ